MAPSIVRRTAAGPAPVIHQPGWIVGWNVLDNPGVILLGRMALIALLIGTSLSAAATERVDIWLVLSATLAWSFVPVLQLLTGLVLVQGTALDWRRALEAYFATHWPWSLWIVGVHAAFVAIPVTFLALLFHGAVLQGACSCRYMEPLHPPPEKLLYDQEHKLSVGIRGSLSRGFRKRG